MHRRSIGLSKRMRTVWRPSSAARHPSPEPGRRAASIGWRGSSEVSSISTMPSRSIQSCDCRGVRTEIEGAILLRIARRHSGFQDDLDTAVLLVAELLVERRSLVEGALMGDD